MNNKFIYFYTVLFFLILLPFSSKAQMWNFGNIAYGNGVIDTIRTYGGIYNGSTVKAYFHFSTVSHRLITINNGLYQGVSGSQFFMMAIDNDKRTYFDLFGSVSGSTAINVVLDTTWNGSDIDLVRSHINTSDVNTFTLGNLYKYISDGRTVAQLSVVGNEWISTNNLVPVLKHRVVADSVIWYLSIIRLKAVDDYAQVIEDGKTLINVKGNDTISSSCGNLIPVITANPSNGTASIKGDSVLYIPKGGFIGNDVLTYRLICSGDTAFAKVYINVIKKTDNISDANCSVTTPPASTWTIVEKSINKKIVHNYAPLVVGDIDGNGVVKIIAAMPNALTSATASSGTGTVSYPSNGFRIFTYSSSGSVTFEKEFTVPVLFSTFGSYAIARYNGNGYIVFVGSDGILYAYSPDGSEHWRSTVSDVAVSLTNYTNFVNIADFNGDDIPEVCVGNKIFSLANGNLLCSGSTTDNSGVLGFPVGYGSGSMPTIADMDNDGKLELVAGNKIYKVNLQDGVTTAGSGTITEHQALTATLPSGTLADGMTQVVDIDNDGELEVVVTTKNGNVSPAVTSLYIWKPSTNQILGSFVTPHTGVSYNSLPMIGDIDKDGYNEIVFITNGVYNTKYPMYALDYIHTNAIGSRIQQKWILEHTNASGYTGMSLFDFNQDGTAEIVYRDQQTLRIIDGSGSTAGVKSQIADVLSNTLRELPIVADLDGDGQAEIVVQGWDGVAYNDGTIDASNQNGYLRVFESGLASEPWAPARQVWNQIMYNAVNVNKDLTIPKYQLNPATVFPGNDDLLGTSDDVRPYNAFLQQQTILNQKGLPIWLTPDVYIDLSITTAEVIDDSVKITLGVVNRGDAALGPPVYVTLYKDAITGKIIKTDSVNFNIPVGGMKYVSISVHADTLAEYLPFVNIIAHVNDKGTTYIYQSECDTTNNGGAILNPILDRMMQKKATLNSVHNNGSYANPVSVLHSEEIYYEISAVNANVKTGNMTIIDTLPAYLNYVTGSTSGVVSESSTVTTPVRKVLAWTFSGVPSLQTQTVSYRATPESGSCASQPLYINNASVTVSDTLHVKTNSTYHHGAGVSIVTFSAQLGGLLFNTEPQAVDYRSTAGRGIIVAPEEGYTFTGWSHEAYTSLRGEIILADSGIMHYDTLTIYGDVELRANFAPLETVLPKNGDDVNEVETPVADKIWAHKDELYIHTTTANSIVRIYSAEGVLQNIRTIMTPGETKMKLVRGFYAVTINNGIGKMVRIE